MTKIPLLEYHGLPADVMDRLAADRKEFALGLMAAVNAAMDAGARADAETFVEAVRAIQSGTIHAYAQGAKQ